MGVIISYAINACSKNWHTFHMVNGTVFFTELSGNAYRDEGTLCTSLLISQFSFKRMPGKTQNPR